MRPVRQPLQHSAITKLRLALLRPADMLAGRQKEIHAERDCKPDEARRLRLLRRQQVPRADGVSPASSCLRGAGVGYPELSPMLGCCLIFCQSLAGLFE
jgi:hypothetical protein